MNPLIAAINDDHDTLEIIDAILTDAGYRVLSIVEGNNAYKIVAREQPDLVILVILDIRLGKSEGGWLVLEQLKLGPATTAIPIIVCSGDIRYLREKREHLILKGCGILEKPFDMKDLLAAVTAALPSSTFYLHTRDPTAANHQWPQPKHPRLIRLAQHTATSCTPSTNRKPLPLYSPNQFTTRIDYPKHVSKQPTKGH